MNSLSMILINGLVTGGVFALLAVGFSLIFGVARILNMAHTAFYMITAFLIYVATEKLELSLVPSLFLPVVFTILFAVVSYKLLFDRVKTHENAVLIISLALALLCQEVLLLIFKGLYHKSRSFAPGFLEIYGLRILYHHLIALGTSLVALVCLWLVLTKTMLGKAIRAIADDREIANLMGIDVGRVSMITIAMSGGLAGIAAVAVGPIYVVEPSMWIHPLIMILAIVVLGGVGSIKGSIIAAFILAFAETSVVFLVPSGGFLKGAVSLSVMVVVLVLRPEGLFGVLFEEERL